MSKQNKVVANGYHLEWSEEMADTSLSPEPNPKVKFDIHAYM